MDFVSLLLSTLLFAAFVPGVLGTYPKGGTKGTVLLTHAVIFALVATVVMKVYWNMRENMTNWGDRCPNGYIMGVGQNGSSECVPSGQPTYQPMNANVKSV